MPLDSRRTAEVLDSQDDMSIVPVESSDEWDRFVAHADGHIAQTWDWGELKRQSGWSPVRVGIRRPNGLTAGVQILVREVGVLGAIGYVDGGPLALAEPPVLTPAVRTMIAMACKGHRIRALIVDLPENLAEERSVLQAAGYVDSYVKTSLGATVRVSLGRSEEDLLAAMKPKTRYNIRKGIRSGVVAHRGTAADLATFHRLLALTAERQGFVAPTESYLAEMWEKLEPKDRLKLFLAEVEGEVVGGLLLTASGDTVTVKRGAWNNHHGEAKPNEVLHWMAMSWARESGFAWYDFEGIERDVAEALVAGEDPGEFEGVTRFKLGFGGAVVLLPRSLVLVPNRVLRMGYRVVVPRLLRMPRVKRSLRALRTR